MRRTKIICTIGPATESEQMLKKLIKAGMTVARLNFSHGSYDWHQQVMKRIQNINTTLTDPIGIMLDTQGPEIRTIGIKEEINLKAGERIRISFGSVCDQQEGEKCINVTYRKIVDDVDPGDIIVLDNGAIEVEVIKKNSTHLYGKVLNKGTICNRKHVNLPGIHVRLPSITAKDKRDILFGIKNKVDFLALSFVRSASDICILRRLMNKHKYDGQIIAKIEDRDAVKHLDEIIDEADGIMVARGDLGIEIPIEEIPALQRKIINKCLHEGKPVIIATHLLESMSTNPFPTRAEVTDIANGVWEKADALMLSGETTTGRFPIRSVKVMSRIIKRTEQEMPPDILHPIHMQESTQEIARAACVLANNIKAKAILVFTKSGRTAKLVSNFRPKTNIYAFSKYDKTQRKTSLYFGVTTFCNTFFQNPEKTIELALSNLKKWNKVKHGDQVVIVSNILAGAEKVEAIQVREIK